MEKTGNQGDLVSIVMPTYNSMEHIEESINSVFSQTHTNWELVIIDDCSSDGTYDLICNRFSHDERVKLVSNKVNQGAGITRNVGIRLCSSNYIAFIDADDVWMPEKLDKQLTFMKINDSSIVHTSYVFISESGDSISGKVDVSHEVNLTSYMRNTEIGMSTSLINLDVTGPISFDKIRTRQDTKLWLGLLSLGLVANGLNESLVKYRVRKGQISKNKIKVAFTTFKIYMGLKELPIFIRVLNFLFYTFNGFYKRIRS